MARRERDFNFLRLKWSWCLVVLLALIVCFQITLTVLIGLNILDYGEKSMFLKLQTGEFFGQVLGLCAIVVAFLFPKLKDDDDKKKKSGNKQEESDSDTE